MNVSYALKFDLNLLDLFSLFFRQRQPSEVRKNTHKFCILYFPIYMHVGVVCIVMYIYVCISVYIGM